MYITSKFVAGQFIISELAAKQTAQHFEPCSLVGRANEVAL